MTQAPRIYVRWLNLYPGPAGHYFLQEGEKTMVDMKIILTRNMECPVREVGNGLVIASPVGNDTLSIAEIGAFIWKRLDGTMALDDILKDILQEYEVAQATAEKDLQAFISQLLEAELVQPA